MIDHNSLGEFAGYIRRRTGKKSRTQYFKQLLHTTHRLIERYGIKDTDAFHCVQVITNRIRKRDEYPVFEIEGHPDKVVVLLNHKGLIAVLIDEDDIPFSCFSMEMGLNKNSPEEDTFINEVLKMQIKGPGSVKVNKILAEYRRRNKCSVKHLSK